MHVWGHSSLQRRSLGLRRTVELPCGTGASAGGFAGFSEGFPEYTIFKSSWIDAQVSDVAQDTAVNGLPARYDHPSHTALQW